MGGLRSSCSAGLQASGFGVEGSEIRDQGLGLKVQRSGFRVEGLEIRVQGLGLKVQGLGFRDKSRASAGFRVYGVGLKFRVWGLGFWV